MYRLEMHYKSGMQNSEPFLEINNEIFQNLYFSRIEWLVIGVDDFHTSKLDIIYFLFNPAY